MRYLQSGAFLSALFENWESEFLQMAAYVMLTAVLFQRGSAESRDPGQPRTRQRFHPEPGPRVAGWLYAHSLGMAMTILFAVCFVLHWLASVQAANEELGAAWRSHSVRLGIPEQLSILVRVPSRIGNRRFYRQRF